MPAPMLPSKYKKNSDKLKESAKIIAEKSMSAAALQLRGDAFTADVGVSVDGSWQRKGFTSLNKVITAIPTDIGKVLDTAIILKSCKCYTKMQTVKTSDPKNYENWLATHQCSLNYKGSSPAMESIVAEKIFNRTITKQKLYYTCYYGDVDSEAYSAVRNVYSPDKCVDKFECRSLQKRVGTRL